ncbi:MAG: hypothetical protein IT258_01895 [Saprospiraceae bacterium]|nr:hypothetical protein [Saprospiraceae bacterium]
MKSINTSKGIFSALQTVTFLAISFFSTLSLQAQEVSLKILKSDNLWLGVENLVQVSVPGIPSEKIFIGSDGVNIEKLDDGIFKLGFRYHGKTTLTVHGEGFKYKNFDFDVKRLPDPIGKLPDPVAALQLPNGQIKRDGEITATEFRQALGVGFVQDSKYGNNYFEIVSFNLVRVPKVGDPSEAPNTAKVFGDKSKSLVFEAQSGDRFYFEEVMAIMPGDAEPRKINSLVFHIK